MKKILIAAFIIAVIQFDFIDSVNALMFVPHDNVTVKFTTYKKNGVKTGCNAGNRKFFTLKVNKRGKPCNIYTKTISPKGEGFPTVVYRAGGTGIYLEIDNNPENRCSTIF